jgi:acetylornithine deacetylase
MNMCLFISEYLKLPYLTVQNVYFGKPTVNFEKIEGGLYLSAVPDRCIACLDSRLIPETPPEMVQTQVQCLMEKLNIEHCINVRETDPPKAWRPARGYSKAQMIPPEHDFTRRVVRAVNHATGSEAIIAGCPAWTLAGVMIERGIPAVICGPGTIAQAHTADEWVEVKQIVKAARIYAALMAEM